MNGFISYAARAHINFFFNIFFTGHIMENYKKVLIKFKVKNIKILIDDDSIERELWISAH